MSDTPRTDAFEALVNRPTNWWDFARELERENSALKQRILDDNKDKERIDWLADPKSNLTLICLFPSWGWSNRVREDAPAICENLRDAIDAARKEAQP